MPDPTYSNLPEVLIDQVKLTGSLAGALGECWVESSGNLPAAFHLTFRGAAEELMKEYAAQLRIGARVSISAIADGKGKNSPLITGPVTAIETEYKGGIAITALRGLDYSFKMLRQRRAYGWRGQSASEIVTKLAALDGVEVGLIELTSPVYKLITQPNVSDWQFVRYLAERSDMRAYFDGEGRLQFRKAGPVPGEIVELEFKKDVLYCRTGITASDQVSEVISRGWNVDEKRPLRERVSTLANLSAEYTIGATPADAEAAFGKATLTETGTPYATSAEAHQAARSLADDITSAFAEMEIEARGWPGLAPGVPLQLTKAGPQFDGMYTVTATRHVWDMHNNYSTWVWVTGRQIRTLYGLASGGAQQEPRIMGVVNALVTDNRDETQQGRVKLTFPWFDDDYTTDWVRTVQFGGNKGGGVISPEIGDEVLVAFDRGSMDHPYVIGGLYSNVDKPSPHDTVLETGGELNRKSLVTRSGHRLELLEDQPAQKTGVRLRSGNEKLTVFLNEAKSMITISGNGEIDISGEDTVTISSHSRLELRAPRVSVIGNEVNVIGNTSIEGDVAINGVTTMRGAVSITGVLTQAGAVNVAGTLSVAPGPILQDGVPVVP
jgi:phage protein D/phage baseplate assembly protein gpV